MNSLAVETEMATFLYTATAVTIILMTKVRPYEHPTGLNVAYGACTAAISIPLVNLFRFFSVGSPMWQAPQAVASIVSLAGMFAVVGAFPQPIDAAWKAPYVAAIVIVVGGALAFVVMAILLGSVCVRPLVLQEKVFGSRVSYAAATLIHAIIVVFTVVYAFFTAFGNGVPVSWSANFSYMQVVAVAVAVDLMVLEPLKVSVTRAYHRWLFRRTIGAVVAAQREDDLRALQPQPKMPELDEISDTASEIARRMRREEREARRARASLQGSLRLGLQDYGWEDAFSGPTEDSAIKDVTSNFVLFVDNDGDGSSRTGRPDEVASEIHTVDDDPTAFRKFQRLRRFHQEERHRQRRGIAEWVDDVDKQLLRDGREVASDEDFDEADALSLRSSWPLVDEAQFAPASTQASTAASVMDRDVMQESTSVASAAGRLSSQGPRWSTRTPTPVFPDGAVDADVHSQSTIDAVLSSVIEVASVDPYDTAATIHTKGSMSQWVPQARSGGESSSLVGFNDDRPASSSDTVTVDHRSFSSARRSPRLSSESDPSASSGVAGPRASQRFVRMRTDTLTTQMGAVSFLVEEMVDTATDESEWRSLGSMSVGEVGPAGMSAALQPSLRSEEIAEAEIDTGFVESYAVLGEGAVDGAPWPAWGG
jgi:hypothetical protein